MMTTLPVVSIEADSGGVAEDMGPAKFKLTATGLSADTTLSINATPAEVSSADFLTSEVEATAADFDVVFSDPDNDDIYTGELSVAIDDDEVGEATGKIQLTLNADSGAAVYTVGSDAVGVITFGMMKRQN